jgi:hypothetical protein
VIRLRRITALTILAGLLALPLLGLAAGDACCGSGSPCAPGAAPCDSLGPTPCCDADRGVAGSALNPAAASVACPAPVETREPPSGCAQPLQSRERAEWIGSTSALRLSVVRRI